MRVTHSFDVSCQCSAPQSLVAFLETNGFEDAIAISLGGDADTMATIAGGIAEALYDGVPEPNRRKTFAVPDDRLLGVVEEFVEQFGNRVLGRKHWPPPDSAW